MKRTDISALPTREGYDPLLKRFRSLEEAQPIEPEQFSILKELTNWEDVYGNVFKMIDLASLIRFDTTSKSQYDGDITKKAWTIIWNNTQHGKSKWSDCNNEVNKNKWNFLLCLATDRFVNKISQINAPKFDLQKIYNSFETLMDRFPLFGVLASSELLNIQINHKKPLEINKNLSQNVVKNRVLMDSPLLEGGDHLLHALYNIKFITLNDEDDNNELRLRVFKSAITAIENGIPITSLMINLLLKLHNADNPYGLLNKNLMGSLLFASSDKKNYSPSDLICRDDKNILLTDLFNTKIPNPSIYLYYVRKTPNLPFEESVNLLNRAIEMYSESPGTTHFSAIGLALVQLAHIHEKQEGDDPIKIAKTNEYFHKILMEYSSISKNSYIQQVLTTRKNKGFTIPDIIYLSGSSVELYTHEGKTMGKVVVYKTGIIYQGEMNGINYHGQGKLTDQNGVVVAEGTFKNNALSDGICTYISKDGSYSGDIKNGAKNGFGKFVDKTGRITDGEWIDGKFRNGKGHFSFGNDIWYEGDFKNGRFNGHGKVIYSTKEYFEGNWIDDCLTEGKGYVLLEQAVSFEGIIKNLRHFFNGTFLNPTGTILTDCLVDGTRISTYEGKVSVSEWKNGFCINGEGFFISSNNERYDGQFKDGKFHGQGTLFYPKGKMVGEWKEGKLINGEGVFNSGGTIYEGKIQNELREGFGVLRYPSGNFYTGNFKEGKFDGQGAYSYSNGKKCDGEWKEDKLMNGKGYQSFKDGSVYDGIVKNGSANGHGTRQELNGNWYQGQFKDGLPHGIGTIRLSNGQKVVGEWDMGVLINGNGYVTYPDGSIYVGEIRNKMRNGWGTMNLPNGMQLNGLWINNVLQ